MSFIFNNLATAENFVKESLRERSFIVSTAERIIVDRNRYGSPIFHSRIKTEEGYFQVKYQKSEHMPLADHEIRSAHKENERLKYAIRSFGKGNDTDIGINENVLFDLINVEEKSGLPTFLLNAVGESKVYSQESKIYWCRAREFYEFSMCWGTVIFNSSAYGGTVYLVPTGWMKLWSNPISAPPSLM